MAKLGPSSAEINTCRVVFTPCATTSAFISRVCLTGMVPPSKICAYLYFTNSCYAERPEGVVLTVRLSLTVPKGSLEKPCFACQTFGTVRICVPIFYQFRQPKATLRQ